MGRSCRCLSSPPAVTLVFTCAGVFFPKSFRYFVLLLILCSSVFSQLYYCIVAFQDESYCSDVKHAARRPELLHKRVLFIPPDDFAKSLAKLHVFIITQCFFAWRRLPDCTLNTYERSEGFFVLEQRFESIMCLNCTRDDSGLHKCGEKHRHCFGERVQCVVYF